MIWYASSFQSVHTWYLAYWSSVRPPKTTRQTSYSVTPSPLRIYFINVTRCSLIYETVKSELLSCYKRLILALGLILQLTPKLAF